MSGQYRRLYLTASRKSSGKTCLALGLLHAWRAQNIAIQPFKKGPDYIDPAWLARAAGRPCYNLDFNTQEPEEIQRTAARNGEDAALIEGTKGLFDGVAEDGSDSNAAMAKLLQAPVLLTLDCDGMTRGVAPLVLGYQQFDTDLQWAGIILNRTGGSRHESKLVQAIEQHTDLAVLGAVGKSSDMQLSERHLGLITDSEHDDADFCITAMGRCVAEGVELERLLEQANGPQIQLSPQVAPSTKPDLRIGYARDAAFGFYYADDLEQFAQQGVELVPVDTLQAQTLPKIDGLWLGGGFPETQAGALAANTALKSQLHEQISAGLPTYAECGGLMYLCQNLTWQGQTHRMVGFIPGDCIMNERPQGRGLVTLEASSDFLWPGIAAGSRIPAHEFHYSRLENLDANLRWGWQVTRGVGATGGKDGMVLGNLFANYCHLRHTQRCAWVQYFVDFVRDCAKGHKH